LNDPNSDLWISLDEAVRSTGASRRAIQDWVRSGQVKREKRKGKVFLWVADLTQIIPLTRKRVPEPDEVPTPEPEVLAPSETFPGAPLKMLGEKLKENQEMQEEILSKVGDVKGALLRLEEIERSPSLDERTVKELSLLGSVFRSIHQQNEKVGLALGTQEEIIKELGNKLETEQGWRDRWGKIRSKLTLWKALTCIAIIIFIALSVIGFQEHLRREGAWNLELVETINKKEGLINDLDQERLNSTRKDRQIKEVTLNLNERETMLKRMEEERQLLQKSHAQQQEKIRMALQHLQNRELEMERLRLAHQNSIQKLDARHKGELSRMETRFDKTLKVLKEEELKEKETLFD
jgi:hypothetical protein